MSGRIKVSSADFARNIGLWQEKAIRNPVWITRHGRERLVLISTDHYSQCDGGAAAEDSANKIAELTLRIQSLLDAIGEGYLVHDSEMRIVDVNGVAQRHFGLAREQLCGRALDTFMRAERLDFYRQQVMHVIRSREMITFEMESNIIPSEVLHIRMFPHPHGVTSLFLNVTEQRRMARELQVVSSLRRAAEGHCDVAFFTLDGLGKREEGDPAFSEWTGFSERLLEGRVFADLVAPATRGAFVRALQGTLQDREVREVDIVVIARSGQEIALRVSLAPIVDGFVVRGASMLMVRRAARM